MCAAFCAEIEGVCASLQAREGIFGIRDSNCLAGVAIRFAEVPDFVARGEAVAVVPVKCFGCARAQNHMDIAGRIAGRFNMFERADEQAKAQEKESE